MNCSACSNPPAGLTLLHPLWEVASDIAKNGMVWRKNNPQRSACQRSHVQKRLSRLPMTSKSACAVARRGPDAADSPGVMWYLLQRFYMLLRPLGAPLGQPFQSVPMALLLLGDEGCSTAPCIRSSTSLLPWAALLV